MEILYEENGEFSTVVFDATIRELHSASSIVTEHAVEEGVNRADHVRPELERLSVEAQVSNTPIRSLGVDGAVGSVSQLPLEGMRGRRILKTVSANDSGGVVPAQLGELAIKAGANVLQFPSTFDRVTAVYNQLKRLKDEAIEVTVVTSLRQYDRMMVVNLSAPREAASRHSVTFQIDLQEIKVAVSELVDAPEPLEVRARREVNRGAQTASDEVQGDNQLRSGAAALVEDYLGIGLIHRPQRSGQGIFTR